MAATLHGDVDALTSPASRIVLGQPVGVGTGSLSLVHHIHTKQGQQQQQQQQQGLPPDSEVLA